MSFGVPRAPKLQGGPSGNLSARRSDAAQAIGTANPAAAAIAAARSQAAAAAAAAARARTPQPYDVTAQSIAPTKGALGSSFRSEGPTTRAATQPRSRTPMAASRQPSLQQPGSHMSSRSDRPRSPSPKNERNEADAQISEGLNEARAKISELRSRIGRAQQNVEDERSRAKALEMKQQRADPRAQKAEMRIHQRVDDPVVLFLEERPREAPQAFMNRVAEKYAKGQMHIADVDKALRRKFLNADPNQLMNEFHTIVHRLTSAPPRQLSPPRPMQRPERHPSPDRSIIGRSLEVRKLLLAAANILFKRRLRSLEHRALDAWCFQKQDAVAQEHSKRLEQRLQDVLEGNKDAAALDNARLEIDRLQKGVQAREVALQALDSARREIDRLQEEVQAREVALQGVDRLQEEVVRLQMELEKERELQKAERKKAPGLQHVPQQVQAPNRLVSSSKSKDFWATFVNRSFEKLQQKKVEDMFANWRRVANDARTARMEEKLRQLEREQGASLAGRDVRAETLANRFRKQKQKELLIEVINEWRKCYISSRIAQREETAKQELALQMKELKKGNETQREGHMIKVAEKFHKERCFALVRECFHFWQATAHLIVAKKQEEAKQRQHDEELKASNAKNEIKTFGHWFKLSERFHKENMQQILFECFLGWHRVKLAEGLANARRNIDEESKRLQEQLVAEKDAERNRLAERFYKDYLASIVTQVIIFWHRGALAEVAQRKSVAAKELHEKALMEMKSAVLEQGESGYMKMAEKFHKDRLKLLLAECMAHWRSFLVIHMQQKVEEARSKQHEEDLRKLKEQQAEMEAAGKKALERLMKQQAEASEQAERFSAEEVRTLQKKHEEEEKALQQKLSQDHAHEEKVLQQKLREEAARSAKERRKLRMALENILNRLRQGVEQLIVRSTFMDWYKFHIESSSERVNNVQKIVLERNLLQREAERQMIAERWYKNRLNLLLQEVAKAWFMYAMEELQKRREETAASAHALELKEMQAQLKDEGSAAYERMAIQLHKRRCDRLLAGCLGHWHEVVLEVVVSRARHSLGEEDAKRMNQLREASRVSKRAEVEATKALQAKEARAILEIQMKKRASRYYPAIVGLSRMYPIAWMQEVLAQWRVGTHSMVIERATTSFKREQERDLAIMFEKVLIRTKPTRGRRRSLVDNDEDGELGRVRENEEQGAERVAMDDQEPGSLSNIILPSRIRSACEENGKEVLTLWWRLVVQARVRKLIEAHEKSREAFEARAGKREERIDLSRDFLGEMLGDLYVTELVRCSIDAWRDYTFHEKQKIDQVLLAKAESFAKERQNMESKQERLAVEAADALDRLLRQRKTQRERCRAYLSGVFSGMQNASLKKVAFILWFVDLVAERANNRRKKTLFGNVARLMNDLQSLRSAWLLSTFFTKWERSIRIQAARIQKTFGTSALRRMLRGEF